MTSQTEPTPLSSTAQSPTNGFHSSMVPNQSTTTNSSRQSQNNVNRRVLWASISVLSVILVVTFSYLFTLSSLESEAQLNDRLDDGQPRRCESNCCQTDVCHRYSRNLSIVMDFTVNPCDDFYKYACGNLPKLAANQDYSIIQQTRIDEILRFALEDNKATPSKSKALKYLVDLHRECVDIEQRKQIGSAPIRDLLKQVLGSGQWPLLLGTPTSTSFASFWNFENSRMTNDSSRFYAIWNYWQSRKTDLIQPEDDQPDVHQWMDCNVETALLGMRLSLIEVVLQNIQVDTSEKLRLAINRRFQARQKIGDLYLVYKKHKKDFLSSTSKWNISMDEALFEVMEFDLKLAQIYKEFMKHNRIIDYYFGEAITLAELKHNYSSSQFDWTLLLNKFARRTGAAFRFTDQDSILVRTTELEIFKPFTELITNTPIRVLKNVMALQVLNLNLYMVEDFHHENISPSEMCLQDSFHVYHPLLTRLFIDNFGKEKIKAARDDVIEMLAHFTQQLHHSLKHGNHSWLDDQTRRSVLDKFDAMKFSIGFPDWILQDEILDQEFGFDSSKTNNSLQVVNGHYVASYFNLRQILNSEKFRKMKMNKQNETSDFDFVFSSFAYNYYNDIAISYRLFYEGPWFGPDYPASINYGNIGSKIGHEMFHGFDNNGRHYDKHGLKGNWWTRFANEYFDKQVKCFVKQYDGLVDPSWGEQINGTHTLSENMVDNCGLRLAFRAYKRHLKHSTNCCPSNSFPQFLGKFTQEQLFFISYGQSFCSIMGNWSTLNTTTSSPHLHLTHSPNYYRVNVPVSNMDQFAQAFNCPHGSRMNPGKKCSIW